MPRCRHPSDSPPRPRRRPRSREAQQRPRGEPLSPGGFTQNLGKGFKHRRNMMNKVDVIKFLDEEWGHILNIHIYMNILIYRDNFDLPGQLGFSCGRWVLSPEANVPLCQSPAITDATYPRGSLERTSENSTVNGGIYCNHDFKKHVFHIKSTNIEI